MENNLITSTGSVNYGEMAKFMGVPQSSGDAEKKTSQLARVKLLHKPVMGQQEVAGKMKKMEIVEAGSYSITLSDETTIYVSKLNIRPFMQRYMYKRFVASKDPDSGKRGDFVKTIMADSLNNDLHDSSGGFNCGKSAGWIQDFKALPEKTQALIKQIKRVRAIFGMANISGGVILEGDKVKDAEDMIVPIIYEVDNRTSFKTSGEPFNLLAKKRHLPIQHSIDFTSKANPLPNGDSYYTVVADLSSDTLEIADDDPKHLQDFSDWVTNYNSYIMEQYNEKSSAKMDKDDQELIECFIVSDELSEG